MKRFVFVRIVGFLEHRHIVSPALVEIFVFIGIYGVDLQTNHAEIFSCQLTGFTDVLYVALPTAFPGKDQDFLHAGVSNDLHFMLDLGHIQLHALDVVIAVEAAVNAVVFAIIGDVQRGK